MLQIEVPRYHPCSFPFSWVSFCERLTFEANFGPWQRKTPTLKLQCHCKSSWARWCIPLFFGIRCSLEWHLVSMILSVKICWFLAVVHVLMLVWDQEFTFLHWNRVSHTVKLWCKNGTQPHKMDVGDLPVGLFSCRTGRPSRAHWRFWQHEIPGGSCEVAGSSKDCGRTLATISKNYCGKRRQVARLMMVCFTPFCEVGFWRKQNDPWRHANDDVLQTFGNIISDVILQIYSRYKQQIMWVYGCFLKWW